MKASTASEPVNTAKIAGLRYVRDDTPGLRRVRHGKAFRYLRPDGKPLRRPADLKRIRSLAIPPAWTEVWICPDPDGHLQATGRDDRAASSTATTRAGARSATRPSITAW